METKDDFHIRLGLFLMIIFLLHDKNGYTGATAGEIDLLSKFIYS